MVKKIDFKEIINKASIVNIISEYIDLIKKGRNYWALCPFHNDSHPSFSIAEDKQIFKCFSCGIGGNAITFVRDFEKIEFMAATKKVCEISGIDTSSWQYSSSKKTEIIKNNKNYFAINYHTMNYFNINLKSKNGTEVFEYLKLRNISVDEINKFNIGLAPKNNEIVNFLKTKQYSDEDILGSGLVFEHHQKLNDYFKNRLIFPIFFDQNNIVAFSGRTFIKEDERSKYKNTSENKVFTKGNIFYNINNAQFHINKIKKIILVEGFFDVIALDKIKVYNVVATMGTALTKQHLQKLKTLSKNVVLFLDGDDVGVKATIKMAATLNENNFNVEIVNSNLQIDVFDILQIHGPKFLINLIAQPLNLLDFLIKNSLLKMNKNSAASINKFLNLIKPFVQKKQDPIATEIVISKISKELDIDKSLIQNKLIGHSLVVNSIPENNQNNKYFANRFSFQERAEYEILKRLISSHKAIDIYEQELGMLYHKTRKILADFIVDYYHKHKSFHLADFINVIAGKTELEKSFTEAAMFENVQFNENEFKGYINLVKNQSNDLQINELTKKMLMVKDPVEQAILIQKIYNLKITGEKNE